MKRRRAFLITALVMLSIIIMGTACSSSQDASSWESSGIISMEGMIEQSDISTANNMTSVAPRNSIDTKVADCYTAVQSESQKHDQNTTISLNADFVEIVRKNLDRNLYLSTEKWFDDSEHDSSQILDHGSYYEVTHGRILGDTCYALNVMEGKSIGDILQLGETEYRITDRETWCLENGETVSLEYVSGPYEDYYMLVQSNNEPYYNLLGDNANTKKDILYIGNLYFSKDCITTVKAPENEFREHTVTIGDYLTQSNDIVGSQLGLYPDGLILWGDFKIDSIGQIISYSEIFIP